MQYRHRPWLILLAPLLGIGSAAAQGNASPTDQAAAAPPSAPWSKSGLGFRVPPIATSGAISYDLRAHNAPGEAKSLSQLVTASLGAESYIYQPWFATVAGTVRVTTGRSSHTQYAADGVFRPFAGELTLSSRERFVTGDASVALFPRSRFPFDVHVDRSDSRIDNALASALEYRTQGIGFSQRYRPVTNAYSLSATFDRREQEAAGESGSQNALTGELTTQWKHNDVALGVTLNHARRDPAEQSQFRSLVARHTYSPAGNLSVSSSVNLTGTREHGPDSATRQSILQATTTAMWQPGETKLRLTGSARALLLRDSAICHEASTVGLMLGSSYQLNPHTQVTAAGSFTATTSDGRGNQAFSGSGGISWQGETIEFGSLRYDRFASGSASVLGGSASAQGAAMSTFGGQIGHNLSRAWKLGAQSTLSFTAGQSLTASRDTSDQSGPSAGSASSQTVLHSLAATWNVVGDGRSAYARASYSDSMGRQASEGRFQLANFQFSGKLDFGRYRSLEGELTGQHVRQQSVDRPSPLHGEEFWRTVRTRSNGLSGTITYRHQRLFGAPRLQFVSRLTLAQDVLKQPGLLTAIPDRETKAWENRLDWAMGRLQSQLVLRISEIDRARREILMWRVQRTFGK